MKTATGLLFWAATLATLGPVRASAAEAGIAWRTGVELQQQLGVSIDVVWSETPLRSALRSLSRAQHVAIVLDRRVDPDTRLDLRLASVPLATALDQIAAAEHLGHAMLGPVAYFGPVTAAARLRTVAAIDEEAARRAGAAGRRMLARRPAAWEDYAQPRELLARLADEAGVEIENTARVPYDVWAAADLPAMSWSDRVTLILAQFDLRFELGDDGRSVRLVPIGEHLALERSYPGGTNPERTRKSFALLAPDAEVRLVGDTLVVRGLLEDHERITSPHRQPGLSTGKTSATAPADKPPPAGSRVVISHLTVQEEPVGVVLERLASGLHFELRIDREALQAAGISLSQRVSMEADRATVDDVLRQLLRTTRLTYHHRGNVVEIVPK